MKANLVCQGSPEMDLYTFAHKLAEALKIPRLDPNNSHNWYRPEYDRTKKYKDETINNLYSVLTNGSLSLEELTDENYEKIYNELDNLIESILPYHDDGIHTIEKIEIFPKPEIKILFG